MVTGPPHLQRSDPPTFITFLGKPGITPRETRDFTIAAFREVLSDRLYLHLFGEALRAMADLDAGGVLVHCSQGKDRTGLLCALILHILGVSEADIVADFELTNTAIDLKNSLPQARENFSKRYNLDVSLEVLEPMLGVHADYLLSAFAGMREQYGSIEGYLDAIGVDRVVCERLRERFLVKRDEKNLPPGNF